MYNLYIILKKKILNNKKFIVYNTLIFFLINSLIDSYDSYDYHQLIHYCKFEIFYYIKFQQTTNKDLQTRKRLTTLVTQQRLTNTHNHGILLRASRFPPAASAVLDPYGRDTGPPSHTAGRSAGPS